AKAVHDRAGQQGVVRMVARWRQGRAQRLQPAGTRLRHRPEADRWFRARGHARIRSGGIPGTARLLTGRELFSLFEAKERPGRSLDPSSYRRPEAPAVPGDARARADRAVLAERTVRRISVGRDGTMWNIC